ncbi:single-stranded-DNA-specific exonuclease RecJ [bacterium BMS3Abin09]|nr:single-stranded-DNA-specific exonuclease RecJ [bacterium BMS3Abin09]GBE41319.1 single-stranded-DNA-specific exonuclease RecJ [bacterium BMS3Bbin09]
MNHKWVVSRTNSEFIDYLSREASISTVLAQVFVNRGIKDAAAIKDFLNPSMESFHDPFLMPDMDKAVLRLKAAREKDETVLVHGDYDADGITSTTLLVSVLRRLGIKTFYYIPDRMTEGYGFGDKGIEKAVECRAGLIITADCGITSAKEVAAANSKGIDIIVTDHHEPPEELPAALAVVNPHRKDSEYPFKYLAGVGVVYKLVQALIKSLQLTADSLQLNELFDLVALGTIADSVALVDENRIFAAYGLEEIRRQHCRPGLAALKEVAGVDKDMQSGRLSYTLIPRINAAGRLGDASEVVELFLSEDRDKAKEIAQHLDEQNRERQKIEAIVLESAVKMIDPEDPGSAIVLWSDEWHPGVIGIVASRLVGMFYRPVFLFSVKDSLAKGSARSIPPLNLYKTIVECSDLLIAFGGHHQAAGLKISTENLQAFRESMNAEVEKTLSPEEMMPVLEIDAALKLSDVNFTIVRELGLLEPYGELNREPVFATKEIKIVNHRIVGNNHLKMRLRQDRKDMDAIAFNQGDKVEELEAATSLDVAFVPGINEWNGMKNIQLNVKAIRPGK